MEQAGGYNFKLLRANLSNGSLTTETLDEAFCRKHLGGNGFIAHYLLSEVPANADPLGPDNKLIFAVGPVTGLPLGGASRHAVGAKSPLTGGIGKAEAGEFWGPQFKQSGFDVLIVEGKADKPVYLWIHDGEAELRDASHLWGLETRETQDTIRSEVGDKKARIGMIGPAGENQVLYACVMHGLFDAAGRGGLGAVMGSKNLKAVAVRGRNLPPVADMERVRGMSYWLRDNLDMVKGLRDFGTGGPMVRWEEEGNIPSHNFRDGTFPTVDKISGPTMKEAIEVEMRACYACPVKCKKAVEVSEPYKVDNAYGGPEYETLGAFGSCCGVDDLAAVARANALCNAYSMDTISAGVTIAFAMECYENGLLTKEDTGGIELTFGNAEAMLAMVDAIARKEGIGELLALGSAKAAAKIGKGAEKYAMQVKGYEFPMHEPRLGTGMALGYMINPHGADHMDNMMDHLMSGFGTQPAVSPRDATPLGLESTTLDDAGPKKVAYFKAHHCKRVLGDSMAVCHFLPYSMSQYVELIEAVTGWESSEFEQIRVVERSLTLMRLFNIREGFTAADDMLPDRFFQPTVGGALKDRPLDREKMEGMRAYYYELMGWDENGVPKPQKLEELGLEEWA